MPRTRTEELEALRRFDERLALYMGELQADKEEGACSPVVTDLVLALRYARTHAADMRSRLLLAQAHGPRRPGMWPLAQKSDTVGQIAPHKYSCPEKRGARPAPAGQGSERR